MYNDIMLMMDNVSFHKSGDIKERMNELGFSYTFTPVYSPQYNGIEEVIGLGKKAVKKKRLEMLLNNQEGDIRDVIRDSFEGLDTQQVAKCMARSLQLLALNQ